jgi:hypothetical protein
LLVFQSVIAWATFSAGREQEPAPFAFAFGGSPENRLRAINQLALLLYSHTLVLKKQIAFACDEESSALCN